MKKLSVYIHIPFCSQKCAYCDFVSFANSSKFVDDYVKKLTQEIQSFDSLGYVVDSIFVGGGTPTILSYSQFESIVRAIEDKFVLDLKEFTVEGNPNSYTKQKVEHYKKLGVTRLSVGVQSLNDKVLKEIGRIHTAKQATETLNMLVSSGLDINCDMMIGLPFQTLEIFENDLQKVIQTGVKSVSCYSLILEEGTPLFDKVNSGKLILPDEDDTIDMYDFAVKTLQKSGLNRYEISNFGKPCLHNIGYWTLKEYIGFGLSAHSLIGNTRFFNTSDLTKYLDGSEYILEEKLSEEEKRIEYIMLALRMESGIEFEDFANKFGENSVDKLLKKIDKDKLYYNITKKNLSIKPQYIYLSNSLIANLLNK